jgi:hypothetical protein
MTKLQTLYVYSNKLTGELPQALSRLRYLRTLLLHDNSFKGSLSTVFQNVSLLKNLEFLDVSNNMFTGELPSELFTVETIQTVAAVANCLSASLPPTICKASNLATLALDGVSSAQSCRTKVPLPWSSAYVTTSLGGSVPPCLWNLANLTVLHLSGNGLTGTLPANTKANFSDVRMGYNKLSSTLVPWLGTLKVLDLSYNRIQGTLDHLNSFGSSYPTNETSLKMNNNLLSGGFSSNLARLTNVSILSGNVFSCLSQKVSNDPGFSSYICGSQDLNGSFYAWVAVTGLIVAVLVVATICTRRWYSSIVDFVVQVTSAHDELPPDVAAYLSCLRQNAVVGVWSCGFCVVIVLPVLLGLKLGSPSYASRSYQYTWTASAAYLSGEVPGVVLLFLWLALALLVAHKRYSSNWLETSHSIASSHRHVADVEDRGERAEDEKATQEDHPAELEEVSESDKGNITEMATSMRKSYRSHVLLLLAVLINVTVMLALNAWYVKQFKSSHTSVSEKEGNQFLVAFIKFVWNAGIKCFLTSSVLPFFTLTRSPLGSRSSCVVILAAITYFNNILAPCLVVLTTDSDCFLNLFVKQVRDEWYTAHILSRLTG